MRESGRALGVVAVLVVLSACAAQAPPAPQAPPTAVAAPAARAATPAINLPPVQFRSAAESRRALMVSIAIPSVDRLLGSGTALAGRAVPLPLDATSVRDMLLSQAGLAPAVGENIDFSSPAGVAVVAMGPGIDAGVVMAIPAKGAAEAQRAVAALGKTLSRRGDVAEVSNGSGGRGWIWIAGSVLVLSDSLDALVKGANLALEARRPADEDVTATLFPEAIAAANGTDVRTALARFVDNLRALQAARGMSMNADSIAIVADWLGLIADASTIEIGLGVDTTRGVSLRARLYAKPGTKLAAVSQEVRPVAFDPLLFVSGKEPAIVAGASVGSLWRAHVARLRKRLQDKQDSKEPGAPAALAVFDTATETAIGLSAATLYLKPETSLRFVCPLKDAGASSRLAAALGKLDRAGALALVKTQMEGDKVPFDVGARKETVGKLGALHYTLAPNAKNAAPGVKEMWKKMFGKTLDIYVAVSGARLIGAGGKRAKAELTAMASGKGSEPDSEVARALDAAKDKDLVEYIDFGPFVAAIGALSDDPRAAMLAKATPAPIPITFTVGGDGKGQVTKLELAIPPAAFSGVGTLLQGFSAAGARR
ncbi:MAG TPA: hypothetical protein VMU50_23270 [Polyangia bacterium]|nr:hypothetical protein [Polyangia bacterium]